MWTFGCNGHPCKVILWGSFIWEIESTFQIVSIYGQGDGLGLEGSYLHLHKTFFSLQPHLWSQVPKTDSSPLWYELGAINVH